VTQLTGKIALISGASRGIGEAIALTLGRLGAQVLGTATSAAGAQLITEKLTSHHYLGQGFVLNVADPESVIALFSELSERKLMPHILVNNAGITRDNLLLRMREEEWDHVISTNLTGAYRLIQSCLRSMMKNRWGRIVNIGSVVGSTGNPGQANYAAAKAGMIGLSKSLAREVGSRGITVNVIAPGFIETDMTSALSEPQREQLVSQIPLGRIGTVNDVAEAVAFLVSPMAGYITGETLHINGGMYFG
jgi:3-oxoacyl-[acyl-carrier protein] reductase